MQNLMRNLMKETILANGMAKIQNPPKYNCTMSPTEPFYLPFPPVACLVSWQEGGTEAGRACQPWQRRPNPNPLYLD